jgi:hypothetical protein
MERLVAIVWALSARPEAKWLAPDKTVTFELQPPGLACKVRRPVEDPGSKP